MAALHRPGPFSPSSGGYGLGKRRTVQVIHLIAVCLGINGFIIRIAGPVEGGLLLGETAILFILLSFIMIFVKNQYDYWAKIVSDLSTLAERSKAGNNS